MILMTIRWNVKGEGAARWHISKDGFVRKCLAKKRHCNLQHYDTRDEAYAALEKKNKKDNKHKSHSLKHGMGYIDRLKAKTESIMMAEVDDSDFWDVDGF